VVRIMLTYVLAGVTLGVLAEALAYALALWLYHIAWMRLFNVFLIFGLLFGYVSFALADKSIWLAMGAGALLGLVIEVLNDRWLKIWYFPGDPWAFFKGRPAVVGVGLSWALVPPIIGWTALNVM
jgi:hypothetical protein